jgi:uncharacterized membrane protein YtjA (UPF0391 family)
MDNMKKIIAPAAVFLTVAVFSGCSAIEGIFKAGALVGIITVVIVITVIIWIISLFRGKS